MNRDEMQAALAPYGADINSHGFITKGGKALPVYTRMVGGRLRFYSKHDALLASGRPDAAFVQHFVERFWFWTKA